MKNYHQLSILELGQLIKEQKVSSVAVVEECLERIKKMQPKINAFITILEEESLATAKQADDEIAAGGWRGPLHGIPIAIKDMYDTKGILTSAAFEHFAHRIPQKDAAAVTKMKEAGAIIIGKTNMHTLAMGTTSLESFYGPVKNPWNTDYIAGGSSGGSAAALAAGLCFATVDTDAVGSCRLPAACCGVVGYKCTWGLIDNSGILDGEQADPVILKLATTGIMARHVEDVRLVAGVLSLKELVAEVPTHVGIVANFGSDQVLREMVTSIADTLTQTGYTTTSVEAPFDPRPDMTAMDSAREQADVFFGNTTVAILPTLASAVPKAKDVGSDPQALSPQNTFFANYLGLPAISVPFGLDGEGLPLAIQVVGKLGKDAEVFAMSEAIAKIAPKMAYVE